ncbi:4-carboxy-4-hydroxy-2-oxoadipate aldolase/oxaloacetate decarboxylase [Microbacterium sp. MEC084]|uniref:4-carboxy-4-hydroxy-2-oxoadipate aldolase/oxaloacetate decarboxylase n=1 Tax=unclassified Microbacterium TaxID=2609290 RepID=UPI0006FF8D6B|nr:MULTISPECIES: 4-carboxy-4-hydroxy-2-oxoadipate aldolase/oxaloacetate decarboxylase [unclassified Microbacterium]KQZ11727.1 4-carboxy-4-hydroxy-2-oxoadipate aldolase/oxaloacetate decarboxylase [Microbacterium sp. Root53]MCD1269397.1 4-carboxy-4-hydroxy-2-oxoadipate aldolase/oxaloacetate decarboxylase [Microbacterium sp. MEC084]
MPGVVVTDPPRTPLDQVDALAAFGVATIHEAQGRTGLLGSSITPIQQNVRVAGNAVTVTVAPGDNTMIGVAVEQCQEGDILVVVPTSPCDMGYFGDLLATSLKARGVRGLVIEAGVRDVADLREMGFAVWSSHVSAEGTRKGALGDVNVPISVAGRIVEPGDVVVADDDGVVIVPRAQAPAVARASREREEKEERARARYLAGEIALDVNDMRPMIEKAGIRYVDYQAWKEEADK